MARTFSASHSFRRGCLGNEGRILLLLVNDELARDLVPHTGVLLWNSGRFKSVVTTSWTACAVVRVDWSGAEFAVVGEGGQLLLVAPDGSYREETLLADTPESPGLFKGASCIDGCLVAVGAGYWARVLSGGGERRDISLRRLQPDRVTTGVGFEAVAGFSLGDLYGVGWEGEIWHFDGRRWSPLPSPVNLILSHALCAPTGEVWACGQNGTVVRGRGDRWHALETGIADNLWSLAWFGDAALAASSSELFRFTDADQPERVGLESDPQSFYWLDAKGGKALLSTGRKDVVLVLPDREIRIE